MRFLLVVEWRPSPNTLVAKAVTMMSADREQDELAISNS